MKHKVSFELEFKRNPFKGKFIVLEGIDGSGKTTHVEALQKELEKEGHKVFTTKNPTDHAVGKFIRTVLSGKEKIPPQAIQYLFNADRAVQQEEIIEHLKNGEIVISDRYFWSSVAYGMADMAVHDERLITAYSILSFYHQFLLPDITFFLDTKTSVAIERIEKKNEHEIYENKEFLEKVQKTYRILLGMFPNEFYITDSNHKLKEVSKGILEKVESII